MVQTNLVEVLYVATFAPGNCVSNKVGDYFILDDWIIQILLTTGCNYFVYLILLKTLAAKKQLLLTSKEIIKKHDIVV